MKAETSWLGRRRSALLLSCAVGTIAAMALRAEPAAAQAFQGAHVVTSGAATRTITGPTSETIQVESPSAIINWTPTAPVGSGTIDFLPSGNTATFQNGPNNNDFMVLNRIIPKDLGQKIAFNGHVISQLKNSGGTIVRGGTIVFYSPAGIIVGSKSVFDVGSLLLTTIDPIVAPGGSFFNAGTYDLRGEVDAKSSILIQQGAQINAPVDGSYVAIASPVVQQLGNIRVNGSIGYVAAESLTLNINEGLFDIEVARGSSSAADTLVHQGTTGGPASTAAADVQKIYMVAVPRNAAINLLLQGNVGYDAASAAVENGEIILSAGYNVAGTADAASQLNSTGATINISQARITSDLTGIATTSASAISNSGQLVSSTQDVTLVAPDSRIATSGGAVTIGGSAIVTTGHGNDFFHFASSGGTAQVLANGGGIDIAGDLSVVASNVGTGSGDVTGGL
ncbi:MAG: hypothetical protein JWO25_2983, partial [Alphaproteobacteria bacterium]|nr:hypothetical protein [Alphaproteobacteria bacterium]